MAEIADALSDQSDAPVKLLREPSENAKKTRGEAPAMRSVVVFGNTQTTEITSYYVNRMAQYRVLAFTVDHDYITSKTFCGLPVVPFETVHRSYPPSECLMTVQLGTRRANRLRMEKYISAKDRGYKFLTYVSPMADIWQGFVPGENTWIGGRSTIGPFAQVGNNVCLTDGCYVGHHSVIGDHCFVAAHAVVLGNVTVGARCLLGANCTVKDHTRIEECCIVDAGVYVANDLERGRVIINRPRHDMPPRENSA